MTTWQTKLLDWYNKHKRDLPWRHTNDPYKIWVSEIMLQQTTVDTVIPYYEKFLKKFPTIQKLARASEEDVLKMWSGLGYYSRARNLQKAAQMICCRGAVPAPKNESNSGRGNRAPTFPSTVEELIKLPGIGRYTAGAIASIAFNKPAPILDGNVMRVLSRLYKMSEDPKSPQGQKIFWKKAGEILNFVRAGTSPLHYGDFNQALMELGATVCKPTNPQCGTCPVSGHCEAYQEGRVSDFPKLSKRAATVTIEMSAAVIEQNGKVLMIRRGDNGLLKKMWEFPMVEGGEEALLKVINPLGPLKFMGPIRSIKHSVLNRRLTITAYHHTSSKAYAPKCEYQWIRPQDIHKIPTSSMNKKILKAFLS